MDFEGLSPASPLIGDKENGFSSLLQEYLNSDDRHLLHCEVSFRV